MKKPLLLTVIIFALLFTANSVSLAVLPLTRSEKASLVPSHSIIKKNSIMTKKSSLKSLQAKLKDIKKGKKSVRAGEGF